MRLKKQPVKREDRKELEMGLWWRMIELSQKKRFAQVAATDVTRNLATPCTYTYGYSDEQRYN